MQRETTSGAFIIAASLANVLVLSFHPTGRDLLNKQSFAGQAHLSVSVHALALVAIPFLFLGLLGLARRLGPSDMTAAALVAYGFGAVAVLSAAVASGFVATEVFERILESQADTREIYHALAWYTGRINQGFAKVSLVASCASILCWSAAILSSRRMPRPTGIAGSVVGTVILLVFLAGHLRLDVHGFGIVTFAQSAWFVWLGVLLCLKPKPESVG